MKPIAISFGPLLFPGMSLLIIALAPGSAAGAGASALPSPADPGRDADPGQSHRDVPPRLEE
jgi:hypothetical protein